MNITSSREKQPKDSAFSSSDLGTSAVLLSEVHALLEQLATANKSSARELLNRDIFWTALGSGSGSWLLL